MRSIKDKKHVSYCSVSPICENVAYTFCFTGAETERHKIKDDSQIIRQTNLDRRALWQLPIICHLLDPPSFSLPITFKLNSVPVSFKTGIAFFFLQEYVTFVGFVQDPTPIFHKRSQIHLRTVFRLTILYQYQLFIYNLQCN